MFSDETGPVHIPSLHSREFFPRNGLDYKTRHECLRLARLMFPQDLVQEADAQGQCSYTIAISTSHLFQIRPERFKLHMKIYQDARHVFKNLVSEIIYIGSFNGTPIPGSVHDSPSLHIYLIEKLPGVPLSSVLQNRSIHSKSFRQRLIQDLARIFATSYHHRILSPHAHAHAKGRIGSSLQQRVSLLTTIPDTQLASEAQAVRDHLPRIEQLPWCLTHGDLIPSNIMVDPDTGHITGLLDWAEGEWLPLGVGMYAVDECLGRDDPDKGFLYFEDHEELRVVFWQTFLRLCECTPLDDGFELVQVEMARRLGVLLWRGIAFDNGRLDRLVEEGRDDVEVGKLRVLLDAPSVLTVDGLSM